MKNISIDIETYSDVDLQKCGVYKYVESENFEILLFAYSADGGEVIVVDLAQGEEIPLEIIKALTDEDVTKWLSMPILKEFVYPNIYEDFMRMNLHHIAFWKIQLVIILVLYLGNVL